MSEHIPYLISYDIGIAQIDAQHQKLFKIVNQLFDDTNPPTKEHVRTILLEFNNYMKEHFKDEEAFMRSIGFEYIDQHIKLHEAFIDELTSTITQGGSLQKIKTGITNVAKKFITHIQKEDTKIKTFLPENSTNS